MTSQLFLLQKFSGYIKSEKTFNLLYIFWQKKKHNLFRSNLHNQKWPSLHKIYSFYNNKGAGTFLGGNGNWFLLHPDDPNMSAYAVRTVHSAVCTTHMYNLIIVWIDPHFYNSKRYKLVEWLISNVSYMNIYSYSGN